MDRAGPLLEKTDESAQKGSVADHNSLIHKITHIAELGIAQPHVIEAIVNHVSGSKAGVAGVLEWSLICMALRKALRPPSEKCLCAKPHQTRRTPGSFISVVAAGAAAIVVAHHRPVVGASGA
jgi:hypothetical protein